MNLLSVTYYGRPKDRPFSPEREKDPGVSGSYAADCVEALALGQLKDVARSLEELECVSDLVFCSQLTRMEMVPRSS